MRRTVLTALIVAITSLALAACGSSSKKSTAASTSTPAASTSTPTSSTPSAASSKGTQTLTIAANPSGQLKFTKSTLTATAGKATIEFTNDAPLAHNFTLQQGTNGAIIGATPTFMGGTRTLIVSLKPGKYTYFCSVPGHRQAGMQGTLTVK